MQLGEPRGECVQVSEPPSFCTPFATARVGVQLVEQDIVGEHESLLITEACDRSTLVAVGRRGKSLGHLRTAGMATQCLTHADIGI